MLGAQVLKRASAMRFDLSGCGAGLDETAQDLLSLGPFAESLGYDGLWINEEHFGQGSRTCLSPIPLATALAMRTRTTDLSRTP